jgi:hypothetical protein
MIFSGERRNDGFGNGKKKVSYYGVTEDHRVVP